MRATSNKTRAIVLAMVLTGAHLSLPAHAAAIGYGGRLVDAAGAPLAGPVDLTLRFFDSELGSDQRGASVSLTGVALVDGVFQVSLGLSETEQGAIFGDGSRAVFVEVEAAGVVYPRQSFAAVPFALRVPVDNETLVYGADAKLAVGQVSVDHVSGLAAALAGKADATVASGSSSGSLSSADWTRFDGKQAAITPAAIVEAGGLTTAQQSGVVIKPYGAGANETGELRFAERAGGNFVGFRAPDTVSVDQVWTLPAADGATGQFLTTDGSGVLAWGSPAGGGDVLASANLSDLSDAAAARGNLGLGTLATASAVGSAQITDGQVTDADISATAAITDTKLATIATAGKVSGAAITSGTIGGTTTFAGSGGVSTAGAVASTGNFTVSGTGAATTELRFGDNDNSSYVGFKAPGTVASSKVWTLPGSDGGAGHLLSTDGAGVLSWASPATSGAMMTSSNLSDLTNAATARTNLGLGSLSTLGAIGTGEITDASIVNADISAAAAIATSKLAGSVTSISGHGLGALATSSAVGSAEITDGSIASADIGDGTIVDADVSGSAAVATSKLSGAVTAIAGHGLGSLATLSVIGSAQITDGQIADADVSGSAGIATSKLSGAVTSISGHGLGSLATLSTVGSSEISNGTIADADISGTAAISSTKISFASDSVSGNVIDGGTISNFASTGIDDNASSVAMTLTSGGNVGIGTTAPAYPLDVNGSIYTSKLLLNSTGTNFDLNLPTTGRIGNTGTDRANLAWSNTGYDLGLYARTLKFSTDSSGIIATERMRIDTTGNVGIGTTAPAGLLDVNGKLTVLSGGNVGIGTTSPANLLSFGNAITNPTLAMFENAGGTNLFGARVDTSAFRLGFYTNAVERISIAQFGNVGIGTTAPIFTLNTTDQSTIGTGVLRLQNSYMGTINNSGSFGIQLAGIDNGSNGHDLRIQGRTSASGAFSDLMTVKNNGNVGIGMTVPGQKLSVAGTIESTTGGFKFPDGTTQTTAASGGSGAPHILIQEQQASGTDAGSSSATSWNVRQLNTEVYDPSNLASVSNNQVTLVAGSYYCSATSTGYAVSRSRLRLRNTTDGGNAIIGMSGDGTGTDSFLFQAVGFFTIASAKVFQLEQYSQLANANGLGLANSTGDVEIYATLACWKIN